MIYAPQHTEAGDRLRQFSRPMWRMLYRMHRIAARESAKAFSDMLIYGTGFVRTGINVPDLIAHVPYEEMVQ